MIKGASGDCNPIHFLSNSANIASRSANCSFWVCAEKKSVVRTRPRLCKLKQMKQTKRLRSSHTVLFQAISNRGRWCSCQVPGCGDQLHSDLFLCFCQLLSLLAHEEWSYTMIVKKTSINTIVRRKSK